VIVALILEGGHLSHFIGLSSFILVVGGSFGASLTGLSFSDLKIVFSQVGSLFIGKDLDWEESIKNLLSLAATARKEGVLGLERLAAQQKEQILKTGLQLIADGTDADILDQVLENRITVLEEENKIGESFLKIMGGFAPTLGIIGTVLGLVHVLGNLSNPEKLGEGIAQAFIATLYGISSANLIFLPLGNRLSNINREKKLYYQMLMAGLLAIQSGDNSLIVEEKLRSYQRQKSPAKAPAPGADKVKAPVGVAESV